MARLSSSTWRSKFAEILTLRINGPNACPARASIETKRNEREKVTRESRAQSSTKSRQTKSFGMMCCEKKATFGLSLTAPHCANQGHQEGTSESAPYLVAPAKRA